MEFICEKGGKCIMDWLHRIVYEESLVSDIGKSVPDGGWI